MGRGGWVCVELEGPSGVQKRVMAKCQKITISLIFGGNSQNLFSENLPG